MNEKGVPLDQCFFRFVVANDAPVLLARAAVPAADRTVLIGTHDNGDRLETETSSLMSQRRERFDAVPQTAESTQGGRRLRRFEFGFVGSNDRLAVVVQIVASRTLAVARAHGNELVSTERRTSLEDREISSSLTLDVCQS